MRGRGYIQVFFSKYVENKGKYVVYYIFHVKDLFKLKEKRIVLIKEK